MYNGYVYTSWYTDQNFGYYYVITKKGKVVIGRWNRDFAILRIQKQYHILYEDSKDKIGSTSEDFNYVGKLSGIDALEDLHYPDSPRKKIL